VSRDTRALLEDIADACRDVATYYFAVLLYQCLFFGVCLVAILAVKLGEGRLGIEPGLGLKLAGLAGLVRAYWLARRAAHRLVNDKELFLASLGGALLDGRMRLAFLPLVGHWFEPEANPVKRDQQ
jgi:hypothetical protein